MFRTDVWSLPPGLTTAVETYEAAFRWGPAGLGLITPGYIASTATDPGNTGTTFELRPGLVLGQIAASAQWTNYSPTNTDGSEVPAGVLITAIRITDILTQQGQARFYGILVGGPVQAAKLIGLDNYARAMMAARFAFDDQNNFGGNVTFPFKRFQTKTVNYQVTVADNNTLFDNTGAAGSVTFTLPPIANGLHYGFRGMVAQNLVITSSEGGNIVALNNASANTLTLSTAGQQIGALIEVFSNPAGTKWIVENNSAGPVAITVS
jgi:hypothetical protein